MSPRSAAATVSASLGVCCHTQRLPKRPTYSYTAAFACAYATQRCRLLSFKAFHHMQWLFGQPANAHTANLARRHAGCATNPRPQRFDSLQLASIDWYAIHTVRATEQQSSPLSYLQRFTVRSPHLLQVSLELVRARASAEAGAWRASVRSRRMRACRQADTACPTVAGGACSGVGGAGRCARHGCSASARATGML
jgi:hypothetical protein